MRQSSFSVTRAPRGFTIVELLVSMTVLVLLIVMVGQMVNSATITTTQSGKLIDANTAARETFDRMGREFSAMLKRHDVDYAFNWQNGQNGGANDSMYFFASSTDYYGVGVSTDPISLVGYRVRVAPPGGQATEAADFQLERLGFPLQWSDSSASAPAYGTTLPFLPISAPASPAPVDTRFIMGNFANPYVGKNIKSPDHLNYWASMAILNPFNTSTDQNPDASGFKALSPPCNDVYEITGAQVFRMEGCFVLTDGTRSLIPAVKPKASSGSALAYNLTATAPPTANDDNTQKGTNYVPISPGARWYYTAKLANGNPVSGAFVCQSAATKAAVWTRLGMDDVSGVVVAVAVMDDRSRQIVKRLNVKKTPAPLTPLTVPDLGNAVAALADFDPIAPLGIAATWNATINSGAFAAATKNEIPPAALGGVRVFERYFPLH